MHVHPILFPALPIPPFITTAVIPITAIPLPPSPPLDIRTLVLRPPTSNTAPPFLLMTVKFSAPFIARFPPMGPGICEIEFVMVNWEGQRDFIIFISPGRFLNPMVNARNGTEILPARVAACSDGGGGRRKELVSIPLSEHIQAVFITHVTRRLESLYNSQQHQISWSSSSLGLNSRFHWQFLPPSKTYHNQKQNPRLI